MKVEEFQVESSSGHYSRKVWFSRGPQNTEHPLCIILDGDFYIDKIGILPIVAELNRDSRVPAMSYLIVSYKDAEARHVDYISIEENRCNHQYATFIAEDMVNWAKNKVPSIREKGHLICGVSLSGLVSAYVAMSYPETFSYVLSQSGSFWWNHQWFAQTTRQMAPLETRCWLSVGDQETEENVSHTPYLFQEISQISGVEKAVQVLQESGANVHYQQYSGGHEPGPWKEEFAEAIRWLLQPEKR